MAEYIYEFITILTYHIKWDMVRVYTHGYKYAAKITMTKNFDKTLP